MLRLAAATAVGLLVDLVGGVRIVLPDGGTTKVAFRARRIAENYEIPVMRRFIPEVRPNVIFVDIGAHWGLYTLLAARRGARVVAFEPAPQNAKMLKKNITLSGLSTVTVRSEVVAAHVGEVNFHAYAGQPSWSRSMMGGLLPQAFTVPLTLPSTTLDALELQPSLVKIDVEGAEGEVLKGALVTLERSRPTIFMEVHRARLAALGTSPGEIRATLTKLAYAIEVISEFDVGGEEHISHWICSPPPQ